MSYIFWLKNLVQMARRIDSSLCNTVRAGFNNKRTVQAGTEEKPVGHISIIECGGQATISGSGKIYENFKATGLLNFFSGCGQIPITFFDENYDTAELREMNFDETYYGMHYDCRSSKIFYFLSVHFQIHKHEMSICF